ncbi:MAG: hypothetical protein K2P94_17805 [Rhodospirillaceae bacterium]|nr:hypothetical protein [Rhodospirillaceae bacterium]
MRKIIFLVSAILLAGGAAPAFADSCDQDLGRARQVLKLSKAQPDDIAKAWQLLGEARQARLTKNEKVCQAEVADSIALLKKT